MPRLIPTRGANGNGAIAEPRGTPSPVQESLVVVQAFRDGATGMDYRPGDRVMVRHRSIRLAALDNPEWFAVEFSTVPLDVEWLEGLHRRAGLLYDQAKREKEARAKAAMPAEMDEQKAARRDSDKLERRFEEQQGRQQKKLEKRREERERLALETTLNPGQPEAGFHYEE